MTAPEWLAEARRREKAQTLFYRALAAGAELDGRLADAERLNGLHADEQHHLSRLTARLLELGERPADLRDVPAPGLPEDGVWEARAREREADEIAWYEAVLGRDPGAAERAVVEEILASERRHLEHLGGKWMPA